MKILVLSFAVLLATAAGAQLSNASAAGTVEVRGYGKYTPGEWTDTTIKLVVPGSSATGIKSSTEKVKAKRTKILQASRLFSIVAISDPHTQKICFVFDGQSFYISDALGTMAVFAYHELHVTKCLYQTDAAVGLDAANTSFNAELIGLDLNKLASGYDYIGLRSVIEGEIPRYPSFFDTFETAQGYAPEITAVEVTDETLRLDLSNTYSKETGRFWVDLKARKVTRAILNNQEVDIKAATKAAAATKEKAAK